MSTTARNVRIGLVVTLALLSLMVTLFFIGSNQKLFSRKNEYFVQLETVSGLAEGNPVQLSGVNIGIVRDIRLPQDPKNRQVQITVSVDRKFAERIRGDSRARLKKLGLIAADSYIDITPGSPRYPALEPGSLIPSAKQTNVDQLIGQGEDLVDNFVEISYSLKNILGRVDRGEGLLGELTTNPRTKQRITDTLLVTMNKTNALIDQVQHGQGVVPRLLNDRQYADELLTSINSSAHSLQTVLTSVSSGQGAIPALINDPQGKQKVMAMITNLQLTSEKLAAFTESLETGQGIVPRLMSDKPYADATLAEFQGLVHQLNVVAQKLNNGEGTAGRIISDPSIYESINDILIGINESSMLRWLVRSRQEKGITKRFKAEQGSAKHAPIALPEKSEPAPPPATTTSAPATPPPPEVQPTPAATETAPPANVTAPPPTDTAPPTTTTNPETTSTQPPPPTSTSPQ